jgi:hypothetical protein
MSAGAPATGQPGPGTDGQPAGGFVLRLLLGAQLRHFREAADITPNRAGYEIRASRSKVSRMETGHVGFKTRDIDDLLTLYGVTDEQERSRISSVAVQASRPDWWTNYSDVLPDWFENYLGLESAASAIHSIEIQFAVGLFQTEVYARVVTRLGHQASPAGEIERRVGLRLKRQHLLNRAEPPRIWSVMDEAVLRRPVGGPGVLRAQLRRLTEVAAMPQVTLQVVPFSCGGHAGASGSFHHPALDRAGPAGRGLRRAAHQRPVPGTAPGRRALPGGHGPAQRRGTDACRHDWLYQAGCQRDMKGTGE